MTDTNTVTISGQVAANPSKTSGRTYLLVAVRTDEPARRVDVIPVLCPPGFGDHIEQGDHVTASGRLVRWFDHHLDAPRARVLVESHTIETGRPE